MDTVWEKDIFDLRLGENSVDNMVSLFVIDDYPSDKKLLFTKRVFSFLRPSGYFFFAAYSPNDERMGRLRQVIDTRELTFEIHLEEASFYEHMFQQCGFAIDKTEVFATEGVYEIRPEPITVKREFIVIVARKPSSTAINAA